MVARRESEPTPMKNRTTVERKSERELVVTRTFNGPARIVFEGVRASRPGRIVRYGARDRSGLSGWPAHPDDGTVATPDSQRCNPRPAMVRLYPPSLAADREPGG
jgi:hypothetical protein